MIINTRICKGTVVKNSEIEIYVFGVLRLKLNEYQRKNLYSDLNDKDLVLVEGYEENNVFIPISISYHINSETDE